MQRQPHSREPVIEYGPRHCDRVAADSTRAAPKLALAVGADTLGEFAHCMAAFDALHERHRWILPSTGTEQDQFGFTSPTTRGRRRRSGLAHFLGKTKDVGEPSRN